jgi:hypothetical protein
MKARKRLPHAYADQFTHCERFNAGWRTTTSFPAGNRIAAIAKAASESGLRAVAAERPHELARCLVKIEHVRIEHRGMSLACDLFDFEMVAALQTAQHASI